MNDDLDRTIPDPEERQRLDELWILLSKVSERPELSEAETDELLERIELSAGMSAGRLRDEPRPTETAAVASDDRSASARRRIPIRRIGIAIAAAAVVLLFLRIPDRPITLSAAPGDQISADLPDGTSVVLNSDSRLFFEERRGDGRVAILTGEAWLDVSGTGSTFRVETPNAVVTVLGTRFNVRSRSVDGNPVTDVDVFEGRVAVSARFKEAEPVTVDPEGSVSITGDRAVPVERTHYGEAVIPEWTRGDLVFRDMPYHEAVDEASRRLGVSIEMAVPDMAERRISAAFRAPLGVTVVLEGLCRPFGLRFRSSADGYEIYQPADERDRP